MKNIRIALIACLGSLFAMACEKEIETHEPAQEYNTNIFKLKTSPFVDEKGAKVWLQYTDAASSLIYEDGDKIKVTSNHGVSRDFVLKYRTTSDGLSPAVAEDGWYAQSSDTLGGSTFYAAFVDGYNTNSTNLTGNGPNYSFNINSIKGDANHNKVILAGSTAINDGGTVLSLNPACAILRLNPKGMNLTYVKVGFQEHKIPKKGTLNASNYTISVSSNSDYLSGVTAGGAGEFLYMRRSNTGAGEDDYWYVAIPVKGTDVSTILYLEWSNGSQTTQYRTSGEVTLQRGNVYTVGTERVAPFNVNGIGNKRFKVSSSQYVRFSAGNLQSIREEDPDTYQRSNKWRFAEHQYDIVGGANNSIDEGNTSTWIDLFGWGTSGDNTGRTSGISYEPYAISGTFGFPEVLTEIAGNNGDWGVANRNHIYYGSRESTVAWRTLTSDEWNYLLNRSGKCGYATLLGSYPGLVLLPDEGWSLPEGLSWNSTMTSYSNNSYDAEAWSKMEMAGAIFLPAAGYRASTTVTGSNVSGWYWSTSNMGVSTAPGKNQAKAMTFNGTSAPNAANAQLRSRGFSVRLVMNN